MWESSAAGPRECRVGPSSMSKTTHTASSRELGSGWASDPPEGRAAATSGAEPPLQDFPEGEAWGSVTTGDVGAERRTTGFDILDRLEADPKGRLEHDDLPEWEPHATTMWTAAPHVDFQPLGAWESESIGGGRTTSTTGSPASPPETRSDGASDHDDNADLVEAYAVGAHTPVGTREVYGDGMNPVRTTARATEHATPTRHGTQCHTQVTTRAAHPTGAPSSKSSRCCRASRPQLRMLRATTPGRTLQLAVAPSAHGSRKPPALAGTHKHRARRGSTSPPLRTAEDGTDAEGRVPSDTADRYVDFDGVYPTGPRDGRTTPSSRGRGRRSSASGWRSRCIGTGSECEPSGPASTTPTTRPRCPRCPRRLRPRDRDRG